MQKRVRPDIEAGGLGFLMKKREKSNFGLREPRFGLFEYRAITLNTMKFVISCADDFFGNRRDFAVWEAIYKSNDATF